MAIKAKTDMSIVPRSVAHYDPATFHELKKPQFIEATAEQVLDMIEPREFSFLPGEKYIAVDTETFAYGMIPYNRMPANVVRKSIKRNSKYIPNDFPFCFSICDGKHSFVVYDTLENKFEEFHKLRPLFGDRSIGKIAHNFDFDLHMFANVQVDVKGRLHDTMHISKLVRANAFQHSLISIAEELVKQGLPGVPEFEHMLDAYKAANRITDYRMFPRDLMTQYTGADTWNCLYAFEWLYPQLSFEDQVPLYDIESQMLLVAYWMERNGVLLDPSYKDKLIGELQEEVDEAERKIYTEAGRQFNINSSQQLYDVLCSLGYGNKVKRKRPTEAMLAKGIVEGNPSFDKYEMERLEAEGVPLIVDIQQYKASEKLLNTFATKLYELADATNTVHCNINTIEAKTGRFSISVPSMQNMPRRKDSRVRDAFIAPPGYCLYDFDFKSQESIILVHYSRSQFLMDIINRGGDIHKAVASIIYSIPYDQVSKELRGISKSVEFAIVYGAGPSKVSQMTGLSLEEASMVMKQFLKNAPEVDTFIRTANKVGKERGRVRTIRHRMVYLERGREYACVNYIIQGCQPGGNKVLTTQGYVRLDALTVAHTLVTQTGTTSDFTVHSVGDKRVMVVATNMASKLCSPEHRFGVYNNKEIRYVKAADLTEDDYLYAYTRDDMLPTVEPYGLDWLAGYALGDGTLRRHYVTLCGGAEKLSILSEVRGRYTAGEIHPSLGSAGEAYRLNVGNAAVIRELQERGVSPVSAQDKCFSDHYFTASTEEKIGLLQGLWDSDGGYTGAYAVFTSISERLAKGVWYLMNDLGIACRFSSYKQATCTAYRVHIMPEALPRFIKYVGVRRRSFEEWYMTVATVNSKKGLPKELLYDCYKLIHEHQLYAALPRSDKSVVAAFKAGRGSKARVMQYLEAFGLTDSMQYRLLKNGNFNKVTELKLTDSYMSMYDIEIHSDDHSYVSEGYYEHNSAADSTKTRMVDIHKFLRANNYKTYMSIQVHDSLLQVVADDETELLGYLRWLQTERDLFRVPVTVDVAKCTPTWRNKVDIDVEAVEPPAEMLQKMRDYDIWNEGILHMNGGEE